MWKQEKKENAKSPPQTYQHIVSTTAAELGCRKADPKPCSVMMNYECSTSDHTEFLVITKPQIF